MPTKKQDPNAELRYALTLYHDGLDSSHIELSEVAVFPGLIPAQPSTARKARVTGTLLGRSGPRFMKRGRSIRYRLKDVLDWLAGGETYSNTTEASRRREEVA